MRMLSNRRGGRPCATLILAAFFFTAPAIAQSQSADTTLYVAGYGGTSEATIKTHVLEPFALRHNVRIEYIAGTSAANLARLQAQSGNQQVDLAILDDGPMQQAVELGLCDEIKPFPAMDRLYPLAKSNGQGHSLGLGFVATGFAYNVEAFAAEALAAPTSWLDLADPRYTGRLLVPSITNSYGLHTLLGLQRALKSDRIEPAFDFFEEKVAENVFSFETSSGKISELLQTGQVSIAVWGSGRSHSLAKSGFPVRFVTPREGAIALQTTICPIVGTEAPEFVQSLLQAFYEPEVQAALAREAGWGPSNRDTVLDPETAAAVPYGPEAVGKLVAVDWAQVNASRSDWSRRWTRQIEK